MRYEVHSCEVEKVGDGLCDEPIGIFDSGLGGVSVLKQLIKVMPHENFMYFGDSMNAPYGTKALDDIREMTITHVKNLLQQNAKAVVVACNTATSAALAQLRKMYPDVPLIGIEPAIKPAVLEHPGGKVLVMATPMTLRQEKFCKLMGRYEDNAEIIPLACPGLMEYVERGETSGKGLHQYLTQLFWDIRDEALDAIVLGCTHYPFVKDTILDVLGNDVQIYDGALGTAKETRRRLKESGLLTNDLSPGTVVFHSSGDFEGEEKRFHTLLGV
ncbi:MAG: glutamate racemase [Lachnospiraceae bacterium]|nr:glutamate racemase [Lachnospiraceae bacterium]